LECFPKRLPCAFVKWVRWYILWVNILLCYVCLLWAKIALHHSKFILTIHPKCKRIFSYYIKQPVPLSLPEITWSTPESLQMPTRNKEISVHSRIHSYSHYLIQYMHSMIHNFWHMSTPMHFGTEVPSSESHYNKDISQHAKLLLILGMTKILKC